MVMHLKPGQYLICRCGLAVPVEGFAENGYQCEQCRLAEILTKHDWPTPEHFMDVAPRRKKEAVIHVNSDGLQPHLEAIMWELFERIAANATD